MAVTQGRNEGNKTRRPAKTMTSANTKPEVVTNTRRSQEDPVMFVKYKPQADVLDTGLENRQWHYLWVNIQDPVSIAGYWNDDYRFVYFRDIKDELATDELRSYLYTEDEAGRVAYAENRLMRIPQDLYQSRRDAALNGLSQSAADKAKQLFAAQIEQGKHDGTVHKSATVSEDADNGETETQTIDGGTN